MQLSALLGSRHAALVRFPPVNLLNGFVNRLVKHFNTKANRGSIHPTGSAPVGERFNLAGRSDKGSIASFIVGLSDVICPSTVFRAIPKLIINPINRVSIWARPHILKKVLESRQTFPSFANFYASAAVICKLLVRFTVAALPHLVPSRVKRVRNSIFAMPVSCMYNASYFVLNTPARSGVSVLHVATNNNDAASTIACAIPSNVVCFIGVPRNNGKQPKTPTRQINEFCHFVTSKYIHQVMLWQAAVKPLFRLQTLATGVL